MPNSQAGPLLVLRLVLLLLPGGLLARWELRHDFICREERRALDTGPALHTLPRKALCPFSGYPGKSIPLSLCPSLSLKACFRDHGTCDVELSSIKFLKQPVQLTESRAQDAAGRGEWRSRRARRLRRLRLAYGTGEQGGSLGSGWGIEDSSPESQLASPPPSPQASYLYRWSLSPEAPEDSPVPVYRETDTCVG